MEIFTQNYNFLKNFTQRCKDYAVKNLDPNFTKFISKKLWKCLHKIIIFPKNFKNFTEKFSNISKHTLKFLEEINFIQEFKILKQ